MPDYKWPNLRRNVFLNVHQYYQERQQLVAEVQQKVDRLKREQKKRDELAAKIKVSFQLLQEVKLRPFSDDGEQAPGGWVEHH